MLEKNEVKRVVTLRTFIYPVLFHNCILEFKNQGIMHCVNLYFHSVKTFTFTSLHWIESMNRGD